MKLVPSGANDRRFPRVLLLGGAPLSGKSTVARKLASVTGHDHVGTDDLGAAARAVTSKQSHPSLHPMTGVDYREYYIERSIDVLWSEAARAHLALWPAIDSVARDRASWGTPAIIEGWAILPELTAGIESTNICACWIVVDDRLLTDRARSEPGFFSGASDEELMISHFVGRSRRYDDEVERAAASRDLTLVRANIGDSAEALCDRVLDAIDGVLRRRDCD